MSKPRSVPIYAKIPHNDGHGNDPLKENKVSNTNINNSNDSSYSTPKPKTWPQLLEKKKTNQYLNILDGPSQKPQSSLN